MTQVFLSHSKTDRDFASRLANDLHAAGFPVWKAPESILPGEEWAQAIERGISTSTHFLLLMSPAAVASRWVKFEFLTALNMHLQDMMVILPIEYQSCDTPLFWKNFHAISNFEGQYAEGMIRLLRRLQSESPSRPPMPPDRYTTFDSGASGVTYEDQPDVPLARRLSFEPEMVLIPAGPFLMGSHKSDILRLELEPEQFELDLNYDYTVGKYPVTVGQYRAFMDANGYKHEGYWKGAGLAWLRHEKQKHPDCWMDQTWTGDDHLPVVGVSWHEAHAYTCWLTETTGREYKLLTEAEWEKAARGGLMIPGEHGAMKRNSNPERIWPWGNGQPTTDICNFEGNEGQTSIVTSHAGQAEAQPYGLFHMAGNVAEWCLTNSATPYQYPEEDEVEGENPRVVRGGSWFSHNAQWVRCSARSWFQPFRRYLHTGFRVQGLPPIPPE